MAWSCRSHSPPWSQIGQSSGWLMSRNSITPRRPLRTIGEFVSTTGGSPFGPGRRSFTGMAQETVGFGGPPFTSTRHIRQLPAIDSRSWKQKRGISAPAASQACRRVYSAGTSSSLPSMTILLMRLSRARRRSRSSAFLVHPQPDVRQVAPAEGEVAVAVSRQMVEPCLRLFENRNMPGRYRPDDEMRRRELFEPPALAIVELLMDRRPDEAFQRFDALPYRHVDEHGGVVERPQRGRVVAFVLEPPDEPGAPLGEGVDAIEVIHELDHAPTPPPRARARRAGWLNKGRCGARSQAGSGR